MESLSALSLTKLDETPSQPWTKTHWYTFSALFYRPDGGYEVLSLSDVAPATILKYAQKNSRERFRRVGGQTHTTRTYVTF